MKPQKSLPYLLSLAALVLALPAAQAATLYSHTFDGSADTTINGVAPDTVVSGVVLGADHGTGGTWSGDLFQDGSGDTVNGGTESALLTFSPQHGFVYTFSFTGFSTTTVNDWFGGGFLKSTTNIAAGSIADTFGIAWALNRPGSSNPSQVAHFNATGGTGNIGTANESASPSTVTIVLDTTAGTGLWNAKWFVNNTATPFATQNINATAEANINAVGVGLPIGNTAEFTSMSLDVVPEPSAALLGGLGALVLLRRRR